jgi:RNA polymerase sigma factor (sigma-70 family)
VTTLLVDTSVLVVQRHGLAVDAERGNYVSRTVAAGQGIGGSPEPKPQPGSSAWSNEGAFMAPVSIWNQRHPTGHVTGVPGSTDLTDRDLWSRCLSGDEEAFNAVYDRYASRLLNYAYFRTCSAARAEDVVSLVMFETWRRRRAVRFGGDGSMAGWLFRTAHFVLANENRATKRHRGRLERVAQLAGPPESEDMEARLIDKERLRLVLSQLDQLSRRDREVLVLTAWSGLGEAEMAAALGIPVGTVKSRLSRARRRLADRSDLVDRPHPASCRVSSQKEVLP